MNVFIYSREEIENIIAKGIFPKHTAVVSFYDDVLKSIDDEYKPVDYSKTGCKVIYAEVSDVDISCLEESGLTYYPHSIQIDRCLFE